MASRKERRARALARRTVVAREVAHEEVQVHQAFSGPLPPPELIAAYEAALPGLADRIVRMAEQNGEHRRATVDAALAAQKKQSDQEFQASREGRLCGLGIGLAGMTAAVLIAYLSPGVAGVVVGGILGGGALVSLVSVFVYAKKLDATPEIEDERG